MLLAAMTSEIVSKFLPDCVAKKKKPENFELQVKIRLNSLRIRV
jgi:hypothetical protein